MKVLKIASILLISFFFSCVSDKEEGVLISDETVYNLVKTSSLSFFKKSSDTLQVDPASPHGSFIRVLMNPKAQSVMNDSLNALIQSSFPDESLIVKEVYNTKGGALQNYAVMYKFKGALNNGSGWIWNELEPDGKVIYSAGKKGDQCTSCHSEGTNADLVRTFALH